MPNQPEEQKKLERSEREKRTWLFSLTLFFMLVIFLVWIVNLKSFVNPRDLKKNNTADNFDWEAVRDKFDATMSDMEDKLAKLNPVVATTTDKSQEFIKSLENNLNGSSTNKIATSTATSSEAEIEAIKARLNELDKKIKNQ